MTGPRKNHGKAFELFKFVHGLWLHCRQNWRNVAMGCAGSKDVLSCLEAENESIANACACEQALQQLEQALQQFDGKHQPPTPLHRVLVRTQQQLQAQQQQAQLTSELPLSSLLLSRRPAEVRLFGRESWPAELACVCVIYS